MARPSKKKKKKPVKGSPVSKLTDDILADIISRVPYKSTCCCKCVSTRWRDLISHREHQKKMPQSIVGFFHEGSNAFRSPRNARYFTNLSRQRYPLVDPSLSFLPDCERLDILDGCNGLLLCHCWMVVDPMAFDYYVSSMVSVARLGFDPAVSSHFQVFEFIDEQSWGIAEDELDGDCCGRIKTLAIYSSKTGAWKYQTVEHGPFVIPENSVSAFFNGILHLPAYECVVAVDVEGANWWLVDVPEPPYYADCIGGVFPSQGRLYFAESDGSKLSVWVLEDYLTGKWTLKHNRWDSCSAFLAFLMAAVLFSGVASPWRSAGPALMVIVVLNSLPCLPGVLSSRSERLEVERLHLARSFGGDVKSCLTDRCYALSCLVGRCYARQVFQRLQVVSAGGTWQHGAEVYQWRLRRAQLFARREEVPLGAVVASTIAGPSKVDASVQF
uniref:Uncharacterized protein n=1 Tax=Aegilops tauschii TaxID=37682 RepID=M8AZQ4_AEGTA